jgi:hypothetical protein
MAIKKPETPEEWRAFVLSFIGSLTLADHPGDVCNNIDTVLKRIGWNGGEWGDLEELGELLGREGVTTLYGTSLRDEDDPAPEPRR